MSVGRKKLPGTGAAGLAVFGVALASLLTLSAAAVFAQPASTQDSAWSSLPSERGADLDDPLARRGQAVFDQRCAACHGEIPEEIFGPMFLPPMPGTQALEARYRGALPAALEQRSDLTPEYVSAVVRSGLLSMPFFRPTELSDDDLAALVVYLTRTRGAQEQ
jgi:(+)-pinoresinol hydroxylase